MIADRLADPRDLLDRVQVNDLRGDDGSLDESKITNAIDNLIAERPHLARGATQQADFGTRAGGTGAPKRAPSFGQALKGGN